MPEPSEWVKLFIIAPNALVQLTAPGRIYASFEGDGSVDVPRAELETMYINVSSTGLGYCGSPRRILDPCGACHRPVQPEENFLTFDFTEELANARANLGK